MLPCLRLHFLLSIHMDCERKKVNFETKTMFLLDVHWFLHFTFRSRQDYKLTISFLEIAWKVFCYVLTTNNTKVASNSLFRYKLLPREPHHQNHHLPRNFRQIPINDHRQRCTAKDLSYKTKMINHRHLQDFIEEVKRNWKLDQGNAIPVPHLLITVHQQFLILKLKNLWWKMRYFSNYILIAWSFLS